jgi:hypothetical protein
MQPSKIKILLVTIYISWQSCNRSSKLWTFAQRYELFLKSAEQRNCDVCSSSSSSLLHLTVHFHSSLHLRRNQILLFT